MIGTVSEEKWRTIAADIGGIVQPEKIGQVTISRRAMFAYRAEAEAWARDQEAEGFGAPVIASAAVSYFGPTDAPGNCWSVTAEKPARDWHCMGCGADYDGDPNLHTCLPADSSSPAPAAADH